MPGFKIIEEKLDTPEIEEIKKTKFCEIVAVIGLREIFDKKTLAPQNF